MNFLLWISIISGLKEIRELYKFSILYVVFSSKHISFISIFYVLILTHTILIIIRLIYLNIRKKKNLNQFNSFLDEEDEDYYNSETDNNEELCFICRDEGRLLCCENCFKTFHL